MRFIIFIFLMTLFTINTHTLKYEIPIHIIPTSDLKETYSRIYGSLFVSELKPILQIPSLETLFSKNFTISHAQSVSKKVLISNKKSFLSTMKRYYINQLCLLVVGMQYSVGILSLLSLFIFLGLIYHRLMTRSR